MRTLGRLLMGLLILLSALWLAQRVWQSLYWHELAAVLDGRIETATPSSAYRAMPGDWLVFELNNQARGLRVRSNALIGTAQEYPPETEWWYAFEYQLLDDQGEIVKQGVYHHRTQATRYLDPNSGQRVNRNFLLDTRLSPTDGRGMLLDIEPEWQPARLRIRPRKPHAPLQGLVFRVYESLPNPENQLGYLWQRLPESKRQRLSDNSVYGLELLREREKQNLLRHEWLAVGPMGVEGRQYRTLKLYIARDLEGELIEGGQMPYGLYCDAVLHCMIPLPPGEWRLSLEILELQAADKGAPGYSLQWYGQDIGDRWRANLSPTLGVQRIERLFAGGLLELTTPRPLVLRIWGEQQGERLELTPEPLRLRAYRIEGNDGLTVAIDHVANRPTPFRVDIRSRLGPDDAPLNRALEYAWLDARGNTLEQGRLPISLEISHYDRLSNLQPGIHLTEPERYYFEAPAEVAAIRFSAPQPLLLTTYSRPPKLRREQQLPEAHLATAEGFDQQPSWFLLRPQDEEQLRQSFRSEVLIVQPRPPETDPRLLAGEYDWTLYQPLGDWRARQLLLPRRGGLPVRDHSLNGIFYQLGQDATLPVVFRTLPGHRKSQPRLLFLRDHSTPLDVRVRIDGRLLLETQIAGRQGELQLPALPPGPARLAVNSREPVRWFVNQAEADSPAYLQRLAMQLPPSGLSFEYEKESDEAEVLSGELYFSDRQRQRLQVAISDPASRPDTPRREWTFRDRLYDLKVRDDEPITLLNSSLPPLVGGQRFFLPLGSDLPAGRYRIDFALEGGGNSYLTLYRLSAGEATLRTFFQEDADGQL